MVHEEMYKGLKIKIEPDECFESPSDWGDNNLFLVGYHRDFWIEAPRIWNKLPEGVKRDPADKGHLMFTKDELVEYFENPKESRDLFKKYHVFPLEAYIHSGVALALSQEGNFCDRQWDVSQVGAVFVAKEEFRMQKSARKRARGLVETWNDYLSGNVYCFTIENEEGEVLDSCCGFYGDWEKYCLPEAKSNADYLAKEIEETNKQLKSIAVCAGA